MEEKQTAVLRRGTCQVHKIINTNIFIIFTCNLNESDCECVGILIPALPVVDGAWNEWSYSDCSKSCGGGEQIRIRSCNAPEPQNGGNDCVGIHYEINSCNTDACPQGKTTT